MRSLSAIIFLVLIVLSISCKKFVEIDPPRSRVVSETVFKNDATAISAMVGLYHEMMQFSSYASGSNEASVSFFCGLSADELVNHVALTGGDLFYKNSLTPELGANLRIWESIYKNIYAANSILEGIAKSTTLSAGVKTQLEGEAKLIRAFAHFYLLNLYGDVPLITSTDYSINRLASRTPVSAVYDQIIKDLQDAKQLLNVNYASAEKVRPNKAVAMALLARVYLYQGNWAAAETEAGFVLSDSRYGLESDLNKVFLANSKEAIWQLIEPFSKTFTLEGQLFILSSIPNAVNPVSLDTNLVKSFDNNDLRRQQWVGSFNNGIYFYPFKYKKNSNNAAPAEHSMLIRLAELYLIRAEARAQQNKITGSNSAASDLNVIRARANLSFTTATTQPAMLLAIEDERRKELFTEWGHRWLDLKRTGRANTVLSAKPNWNATDILYPIPELELLANPNLRPQNPGY